MVRMILAEAIGGILSAGAAGYAAGGWSGVITFLLGALLLGFVLHAVGIRLLKGELIPALRNLRLTEVAVIRHPGIHEETEVEIRKKYAEVREDFDAVDRATRAT